MGPNSAALAAVFFLKIDKKNFKIFYDFSLFKIS